MWCVCNQVLSQKETFLLIHRCELICYGMRLCDFTVDIGVLEIAVWQASQSIRIFKRKIHSWRKAASKGKGNDDEMNSDTCS